MKNSIRISEQKFTMFNASCKYAIRALAELAKLKVDDNPVGSEYLARELNIPKPFLSKVLQHLVRKKVISSIKGPNGGYYLTKSNRKARLDQILSDIDCSDSLSSCVLGLEKCTSENPCPVHHLYQPFIHNFQQKMGELRVADLDVNSIL